jgi:hypothetical protein
MFLQYFSVNQLLCNIHKFKQIRNQLIRYFDAPRYSRKPGLSEGPVFRLNIFTRISQRKRQYKTGSLSDFTLYLNSASIHYDKLMNEI